MKKVVIKMIIIVLMLTIATTNFSYAINFGDADEFIKKGGEKAALNNGALDSIGAEFSDIGNVLKYIGAAIIVGATAYMGILYMISPPEKQAKLKQQLIGLVVSAGVIFGGYYIWKIIATALEAMTAPGA